MGKESKQPGKSLRIIREQWQKGFQTARTSLYSVSKRLPWNQSLTQKGIYYLSTLLLAMVTVGGILYLTWGGLPVGRNDGVPYLEELAGGMPPVVEPAPMPGSGSEAARGDGEPNPVLQPAGANEPVVEAVAHPEPEEQRSPGKVVELPPLPEPLVQPLEGIVEVQFGWRRHPVLGDWRLHPGIDLSPTGNAPIIAAMSGVLVEVKTDPLLGAIAIVEHDNGWQTRYGRIDQLVVEPGQWVAAGTVLGQVGLGPIDNKSHLHFELRHNGQAVDPEEYLAPVIPNQDQ